MMDQMGCTLGRRKILLVMYLWLEHAWINVGAPTGSPGFLQQKLNVLLLLLQTLLCALVVVLEMWMNTQNDIPKGNNWIRVKDNHVNDNLFARTIRICLVVFCYLLYLYLHSVDPYKGQKQPKWDV